MRKLIGSALLASALAFASPALATVILVDASSIQGANVLFNAGTQTGTTVTGFTQGGTNVNFTGTTVNSNILRANGGQARVEGDLDVGTPQPNDTYGLTALTFGLQGDALFNNVEFNLAGASDGATVTFSITDDAGDLFNFNNLVLGTGSNFFGFQGTAGESIKQVSWVINGGSVGDQRQLRLDALAEAIPEPASWAMMIAGFGFVAAAMRRRKALLSGRMALA